MRAFVCQGNTKIHPNNGCVRWHVKANTRRCVPICKKQYIYIYIYIIKSLWKRWCAVCIWHVYLHACEQNITHNGLKMILCGSYSTCIPACIRTKYNTKWCENVCVRFVLLYVCMRMWHEIERCESSWCSMCVHIYIHTYIYTYMKVCVRNSHALCSKLNTLLRVYVLRLPVYVYVCMSSIHENVNIVYTLKQTYIYVCTFLATNDTKCIKHTYAKCLIHAYMHVCRLLCMTAGAAAISVKKLPRS